MIRSGLDTKEISTLSAGAVFDQPPSAMKVRWGATFFWLSAFYLVYCARPEDWIPGLRLIPLAKLTAIPALILLFSIKTGRKFRDRPVEANYLFILIVILFASAAFSPLWRGGAFYHTLDFSKVLLVWVLTFLVVIDFPRLRRIIFIQAGSVAVIAVASIAKSQGHPRLEGVLGGIYSNPNDLAFAIVLSLPFCLAFLLNAKSGVRKMSWVLAMLAMCSALFLTASRAGFIDLVIAGSVCLWHFGVKGRRPHLIVIAVVLGTLIMVVGGRQLKDRFAAIAGGDLETTTETKAESSFEARKQLMIRALEVIGHYPILGTGVENFVIVSGDWHEVHMTYLQIAVEGGIPALIIYLMFFARGFSNLRRLRRRRDLDAETTLFIGALHSSLIGFAVGALFAPEAYQFFPYFAVAYTSVLLAIVKERDASSATPASFSSRTDRALVTYAIEPRSGSLAPQH